MKSKVKAKANNNYFSFCEFLIKARLKHYFKAPHLAVKRLLLINRGKHRTHKSDTFKKGFERVVKAIIIKNHKKKMFTPKRKTPFIIFDNIFLKYG